MARKKFSAEFKAEVALEFMKDELTMAQLSSKYGIHPTQIKEWKTTLIAGAKTLFGSKKKEDGEHYSWDRFLFGVTECCLAARQEAKDIKY
jgi:transposase-like protein